MMGIKMLPMEISAAATNGPTSGQQRAQQQEQEQQHHHKQTSNLVHLAASGSLSASLPFESFHRDRIQPQAQAQLQRQPKLQNQHQQQLDQDIHSQVSSQRQVSRQRLSSFATALRSTVGYRPQPTSGKLFGSSSRPSLPHAHLATVSARLASCPMIERQETGNTFRPSNVWRSPKRVARERIELRGEKSRALIAGRALANSLVNNLNRSPLNQYQGLEADHHHHHCIQSEAVASQVYYELPNSCGQLVSSKQKQQQQQQQQEQQQEEEVRIEPTMSQTLQSIHSLSMQLNRAASQGEISSSPQSPLSPGAFAGMSPAASANETNATAAANPINGSGPANKLGRLVGKKAARVKELLLQNLGKADKTTDEIFKMYEENFYKQQVQAIKLQKEFKSYVISLKGAQEASKSLNGCIQQSTGVYQSARHDLVCENLSQMEYLNDDLLDKLRSQVMLSVNEYLSQFGELRDKISKRRRKLIDYDSSRRVYELVLAQVNKKRQLQQQQFNQSPGQAQAGGLRTLRSAFSLGANHSGGAGQQAQVAGRGDCSSFQLATNQLVDEARLLKLREQFNYCKIMYETINSELHAELPMVYEKKMKHLLMTLQNYFSLEAQYHSNASKLFATASDVIDELPMSILYQQQQQQLQKNNHRNQYNHHAGQQSAAQAKRAGRQANGDDEDDEDEEEEEEEDDDDEDEEEEEDEGHGEGGERQVAMEKKQASVVEDYVKQKAASSSTSGMGSSTGDSSLEECSSASSSCSRNGSSPICDEDPLRRPALATNELASANAGEPPKCAAELQLADKLNDLSGKLQEGQQVKLDSSAPVAVGGGGEGEGETGEEGSKIQTFSQPKCDPIDGQSMEDKVVDLGSIQAETETKGEPVAAAAEAAANKEPILSSNKQEGGAQDFLYKVRTSYKYLAEDVDELCFEADELIQVIEFDDSQEQEEGWLMGVREVNGQRGLFPANFTRPI